MIRAQGGLRSHRRATVEVYVTAFRLLSSQSVGGSEQTSREERTERQRSNTTTTAHIRHTHIHSDTHLRLRIVELLQGQKTPSTATVVSAVVVRTRQLHHTVPTPQRKSERPHWLRHVSTANHARTQRYATSDTDLSIVRAPESESHSRSSRRQRYHRGRILAGQWPLFCDSRQSLSRA